MILTYWFFIETSHSFFDPYLIESVSWNEIPEVLKKIISFYYQVIHFPYVPIRGW